MLPFNKKMNQFGHQFQDHDSSSTQSTGQSCQEGMGVRVPELCGSAQPGAEDVNGKRVDDKLGSSLSSVIADVILPNQKLDYGQPVPYVYHYGDPYMGMMAAYGPPAIMHPQMAGLSQSTRVALPHDMNENEPIYVNAKQYPAIMRRRQTRARLEAQNKLVKTRRPYLHESRHLHAMNRVRGSGGRFLNTKQQQPNNCSAPTTNSIDPLASEVQNSSVGWFLHEHNTQLGNDGAGTSEGTSQSMIPSIPDGKDMFHLSDTFGFAELHIRSGLVSSRSEQQVLGTR